MQVCGADGTVMAVVTPQPDGQAEARGWGGSVPLPPALGAVLREAWAPAGCQQGLTPSTSDRQGAYAYDAPLAMAHRAVAGAAPTSTSRTPRPRAVAGAVGGTAGRPCPVPERPAGWPPRSRARLVGCDHRGSHAWALRMRSASPHAPCLRPFSAVTWDIGSWGGQRYDYGPKRAW
jgi:hypothetical protein